MKALLSAITLCVLNFQLLAQVSFTNTSPLNVGSGPYFVTAADLNGDSKVDLVSANYNDTKLSVLTNNGAGGFMLASSPGIASGVRWVTSADVNGDGKLDLITADYGAGGGNTLSVFTNKGNGVFALASAPVLGSTPYSVLAVDVNGDNKPDLVSANANNTLSVLTNTGNGNFVLASSPDLGGNPRSVTAFTNVDGKLDLVSANQFNNSLSFMTNNGNGGFGLAALLSGGNQPLQVAVADVNGDGMMDLISANYGNDTVSVWTNNGIGGFGFVTSIGVGHQPFYVVAADVSGDGKVDLITANYGSSTLTVLTNNGNGGFVLATTLAVGGNPLSVTTADVDGDGRLDLISANSGNNTLSIWLNTTPPRSPNATGTAIVAFGFVVSVNVDNGGYGYTNTPMVRLIGAGGSGAGAVAVVSNGVVIGITITNNGSGYPSNATVVVIDPPYVTNPVLNIAPMSFLSFSNLTVGGAYQLQKAQSFYWTNLPVNFTSTTSIYTQMVAGVAGSGNYRLALVPVPTQAFATSTVSFGFMVHATVTSGGSGYVANPLVTIIGGGGTNAAATSQISGGVVTNINITNPGTGYTSAPTVAIGQPPTAALSPAVLPVMRLASSMLAPYHNYQIQFEPNLRVAWVNQNGGLFMPTNVTNSQYVFITNDLGFFRLLYVP